MQLKIKTLKLQEMMNDAVKGASNNKLIPLTSMLCIELKDKKLTLTTTDGTNYLYISDDNIEGDDFYIVIDIEVFSKLVSKLTTEHTTLTLEENKLLVNADGNYAIELPLDENGQLVKYPNPLKGLDYNNLGSVADLSNKLISNLLSASKASVATTLEIPYYTGYYLGSNIVTTNRSEICGINTKLFENEVLWNPKFVDLLAVFKDEVVKVYQGADRMVAVGKNCTVYGIVLDGISEYKIKALNDLLQDSFESKATVFTSNLIQVLDRLSLFIGPYDDNSIKLTFKDSVIEISSKESTGIEEVPYISRENVKSFECEVDIESLLRQVKSIQSESFNIHWGKDNAIKLTYNDISQIIALYE